MCAEYQKLVELRRYEKGLMKAIKYSDFEMIEFFIRKGACVWNRALEKAARGGDTFIFRFFLEKCPDSSLKWTSLLKGAAWGGHEQLIELHMDNEYYVKWARIARCAAKGGHRELAERLLKKKSELFYLKRTWDFTHTRCSCKFWDTKDSIHPTEMCRERQPMDALCVRVGLKKAIRQGDMDRVNFYIADQQHEEPSGLIHYASYYGKQELIQLAFEKYGHTTIRFWPRVVRAATIGGQVKIIKWAFEYARDFFVQLKWEFYTYNGYVDFGSGRSCLAWAAKKGYRDIVDLLLSYSFPISHAWLGAINGGVLDLFHQMKERDSAFCIEHALQMAARSGRRELVEYCINQGATTLDQALVQTYQRFIRRTDVAVYLIQKGAMFCARTRDDFVVYVLNLTENGPMPKFWTVKIPITKPVVGYIILDLQEAYYWIRFDNTNSFLMTLGTLGDASPGPRNVNFHKGSRLALYGCSKKTYPFLESQTEELLKLLLIAAPDPLSLCDPDSFTASYIKSVSPLVYQ